MIPETRGSRRLIAHEPSGEVRAPGDVAGIDGDVVDERTGEQNGLDLAGLDPEPAHLHLLVDAPQKGQPTLCVGPNQIASAVPDGVTSGLRTCVELHETFGRQIVAAEVPGRDAAPADVQLAGFAVPTRADRPGRARDVDGPGDRGADRNRTASVLLVDDERVAPHRALGGSVLVRQHGSWATRAMCLDHVGSARLPGHDHRVQRRELRRSCLGCHAVGRATAARGDG